MTTKCLHCRWKKIPGGGRRVMCLPDATWEKRQHPFNVSRFFCPRSTLRYLFPACSSPVFPDQGAINPYALGNLVGLFAYQDMLNTQRVKRRPSTLARQSGQEWMVIEIDAYQGS